METAIKHVLKLGVDAHKGGDVQAAQIFYEQVLNIEPSNCDANHNLGLITSSTARKELALKLFRNAVKSNPKVEQFWISYIDTLIKGNHLEDADLAIKKASKKKYGLSKNVVRALNEKLLHRLGVLLQQQGDLEGAAKAYKKLVAFKCGSMEPYFNLGIVLHRLTKFAQAEQSFRQAIAIQPNSAETYFNLGTTLREQGDLKSAVSAYRRAICLKPDYVEAMLNLSIILDFLGDIDGAIDQLECVLELDASHFGLWASVNLAIFRFLNDDFKACKQLLSSSLNIHQLPDKDFKNSQTYQQYLSRILHLRQNDPVDPVGSGLKEKLYVIGESHALVSHGLLVKGAGSLFQCKSFLIQGCKQWHLGNSTRNKFKIKFEDLFSSLPVSSSVLISIGEIDCRIETGILSYLKNHPEQNSANVVGKTVGSYLDYICKLNLSFNHNVIIQGVPCPNIDAANFSEDEVKRLVNIIQHFNAELTETAKAKKFGFLDVCALTDRGDGFSNGIWHIDSYHLSREGMREAWRAHYSSSN